MNKEQWKYFSDFRNDFKKKVLQWSKYNEELIPLQKSSSEKDKVPEYTVENPVVYNTSLDDFTEDDEIKLIMVADNPGKMEQLNINRKYLVGQAGKIAEGFFKQNPSLNIDFRKNVIILNKTPVHSAKTRELLEIKKQNTHAAALLEETQIWMAEKTASLMQNLKCGLWLVGYTELKKGGVFELYRETLVQNILNNIETQNLYVYKHFSMNCFRTELNKTLSKSGNSLQETLKTIGLSHRKEILGI